MFTLDRDAFKASFIKTCAAHGVDPGVVVDATTQLMEKDAGMIPEMVTHGFNHLHQLVQDANKNGWLSKDTAKSMIPTAIALAGAPFVAGAATGAIGSGLKGSYMTDENIKNQEVIDELKRQTLLAKQQQRIKGLG